MVVESVVRDCDVQFKRSQLRKGMVMVHPVMEPKACWEFEGDILILHHPTTISVKYQAMGKYGSALYLLFLYFLCSVN